MSLIIHILYDFYNMIITYSFSIFDFRICITILISLISFDLTLNANQKTFLNKNAIYKIYILTF